MTLRHGRSYPRRCPQAVSDYNTFGMKSHIVKDSDCFHDVSYVVLGGGRVSADTSFTSKCSYCLEPFELVNRIQSAVSASVPGIGEV